MNKYTYYLASAALSLLILPITASALVADIDPNPQTSQCVQIKYNLRYQSRDSLTGGDVSSLQDFLQSKGHLNSEPTGYFGLLTLQAVKDFQKKYDIEPTGFVGTLTRGKISSVTGCANAVNPVPISRVPVPSTYIPVYNIPTVIPTPVTYAINITSPAKGDVINNQDVNNYIAVAWESKGGIVGRKIESIILRNINSSGAKVRDYTLAENIYNYGKETLRIPVSVPTGIYVIYIKSTTDGLENVTEGGYGQSQPFVIVSSVGTNPVPPVTQTVRDVVPTTNSAEDKTISMEATVLSTTNNHAGAWGTFRPGSAGTPYNIADDWNWRIRLHLPNNISKDIYSIVVEHEGSNQRWSTIDSYNWPLVVLQGDGSSVNSSYGKLNIKVSGNETIELSGQVDNIDQSGTVAIVNYTDGTYSKTKIDGKRPKINTNTTTTNENPWDYNGPIITFPVDNANLEIGQTYKIVWSGYDTGVSNYAVYLVSGPLGKNSSIYLGTGYVNGDNKGGSFTWTVGKSADSQTIVPGNGYQIQLSGRGATGNYGGPSFNITSGSQPGIIITSPNYRNRIDVYNSRSIFAEWKSKDLPNDMRLGIARLRDLSLGREYPLATSVLNDGVEKFTVPSDISDDIKEGKYVLEIKTSVPGQANAITGVSEPFIITSSKPRPYTSQTDGTNLGDDIKYFITLKTANTNEYWQPGVNVVTKDINWESSNLGDAKLAIILTNVYSKNVIEVANGLTNTGQYSWTLPNNIQTGNYRITITATDTNGKVIAKDDNDADISIYTPATPTTVR